MKKRVIAVAVCLAAMFGVLAGCGTKEKEGGGEEKKIPIRFMYWNREDTFAELLKLISEKAPEVDFQFEFVDTASYETVYATQMAAGEGPDIIIEKPSPSGVDPGYALDLKDFGFVKLYAESAIDALTMNGKVFSVPGPSWFGGYFYNKGMFEEHGWAIPKTYDEFLDLCGKIKDAGIKPLASPLKNPNFLMHYAFSYLTPAYLRAPAGMTFDETYPTGRVKASDTLVPYLEKWAEVVKRGYVTPDDLGLDSDQCLDEFAMGRAAMFDSGSWDVETILAKNPGIKLDMMPYVGDSPGEAGWLFGGPGICFGINAKLGDKGNEDKLAAAVHVLEVISSPEGQMAYWENNKGGSSYVKGVTLEMPSEYDGCKEVFAAGHVYAPWQRWHDGMYQLFGEQLQGYVAGSVTLEQVCSALDDKNAELVRLAEEAR